MASSFFALLDDISIFAKAAASSIDDVSTQVIQSTGKAAGVVIDDTAVTPRYVLGFKPEREIPVILKIVKGSLINKILILIPILLILNYYATELIIPILMIISPYLCYEGTEKIFEFLFHKHNPKSIDFFEEVYSSETFEKQKIQKAIKTDFILSTEIMVITLSTVINKTLNTQIITLLFVAILITLGVYFIVMMVVKLDDWGFLLVQNQEKFGCFSKLIDKIGKIIVKSMPTILKILSFIGTFAMLFVGGGIFMESLEKYEHVNIVNIFLEYYNEIIPQFPENLNIFNLILFGFFIGIILMPFITIKNKILKSFKKS